MEHISNAVSRALNSSTISADEKPALSDEHKEAIRMLFRRMKGIYGHLWSSRFSSERGLAEAMAEWARDLLPFSPQQIEDGIDGCKRQYDMPPSLPQFVKILRPERAPYHQMAPKMLPKPRMPKERARELIEEMRKAAGVQS